MSSFPCLVRSVSPSGDARYALGDPFVDRYLAFVAGRCRPNTLRAAVFDLKTFFTVVERDPLAVTPADVFEFLAAQRGDRRVVRISDRESGLSARTIARRLSTVSGFHAYVVHLVNGLPATTLVLFVGLTMSTGAFGGGASIANLRDGLASVGLAELGIVAFLVLIVALMSNAFQTPMVKALEGYWKPAGLQVRLLERGLARHDERRQRYGVAQTAQYRPTRWQSLFLRGFSHERTAEMHLRSRQHARVKTAAYPVRPSDEERAQAAEDEEIADRLMPTSWETPFVSERTSPVFGSASTPCVSCRT